RVLLFALGIAVLTGVLFGLAPALHAVRVDIQSSLRQGSRSIAGAGRRLRDALVAMEVAFAVLLLVGAGLLGRSFVRLLEVPTGFFKTLGLPLLRGRLLEETDTQGHPNVVVNDSTMAARLWPGKDPLGFHIMAAQSAREAKDQMEVVGVVRDVRDQSPATDP